jgi:hypothetical protein
MDPTDPERWYVSYLWVSPHRPDRHPEGTDSDLDKTLHICLDSQETAKNKV